MPSILRRKTSSGEVRFFVRARVSGFAPVCKTFADRKAAERWLQKTKLELRAQKDKGSQLRTDVAQLRLSDLIRERIKDKSLENQTSAADTERLLDWWLYYYGTTRVLDCGVTLWREAREKLLRGTAIPPADREQLAKDHAVKAERNRVIKAARSTKPRSPATVNRFLTAMRSCWNFGIRAELIPDSRPWPQRLLLKEPRGRVRFLSDDEIASLLAAAESDTVMSAVLKTAIGCGLRQGEILRLRWADVKLDGEGKLGPHLTVHESKNGTRRSVYLSPSVVAALKALKKLPVVSPVTVFLDQTGGKPLDKWKLDKRWRVIHRAAGLRDFRFHDLRHSFASIQLQNGETLGVIAAALGHKSPVMTMRYSHLVQGASLAGSAALDKKLGGNGEGK
jgi:integrase